MCIAQTLLEDKTRKLKNFYQYSNYNCCIGKYDSCEIAKMELNIVLFILHDGTTYDNHGSMFAAKRVRQVLRTSGHSDHPEPQITLFVSGVARAKPHHLEK